MYRNAILAGMAFLSLAAISPLSAGSLWLGNNLDGTLPLLQTDATGTILRSADEGTVIGLAIDQVTGTLYVNDGYGTVTPYDLVTLTPGTGFSAPGLWDLAFDGADVWGADPSNYSLDEYDPATGDFLNSIALGFSPLGLAWDGSQFLVTENAAGGGVHSIALDGTDNTLFTPFADDTPGGLDFDIASSTIWVGSTGAVSSFLSDGTLQSSFTVADGRFVDGLASQTPEPATFALTALAGATLLLRKRTQKKGARQ